MKESFIGEEIRPVTATLDTARMAAGEPGLPGVFVWRGREIRVTALRRTWKDTGPCRHGSGERYVRKHWYEVATAADGVMKLYCERQMRGKRGSSRWRLFSQSDGAPD